MAKPTRFPNGIEGDAVASAVSVTAYSAADISDPPTEAEAQAIADALETLRDEVALIAAEVNKLTAR